MTTQTLSPPELKTLRIDIDGEIGTLTLDRPDAFNAMNPEMIFELTVDYGVSDGTAMRVPVELGASRPDGYEVLAGLVPGDLVATGEVPVQAAGSRVTARLVDAAR